MSPDGRLLLYAVIDHIAVSRALNLIKQKRDPSDGDRKCDEAALRSIAAPAKPGVTYAGGDDKAASKMISADWCTVEITEGPVPAGVYADRPPYGAGAHNGERSRHGPEHGKQQPQGILIRIAKMRCRKEQARKDARHPRASQFSHERKRCAMDSEFFIQTDTRHSD